MSLSILLKSMLFLFFISYKGNIERTLKAYKGLIISRVGSLSKALRGNVREGNYYSSDR